MLDDSLPRAARGAALNEVAKEDIELYGANELHERIERLQAEIERTRQAIDSRSQRKSAADALFSFKGS